MHLATLEIWNDVSSHTQPICLSSQGWLPLRSHPPLSIQQRLCLHIHSDSSPSGGSLESPEEEA